MEPIIFNNSGVSPGISHKRQLKSFLSSIFKEEHISFKSVSYVFCKDNYLLKLNKQYLNHDTLTDIITFTLSDKGVPIVAEIYISVERVKENAVLLNIGYLQELFRVMIHGILHLCGYSDHTVKQKKIMRQKEDHYLSELKFHVERST